MLVKSSVGNKQAAPAHGHTLGLIPEAMVTAAWPSNWLRAVRRKVGATGALKEKEHRNPDGAWQQLHNVRLTYTSYINLCGHLEL